MCAPDTNVHCYKAWIKLAGNLPRWPGTVYVRKPLEGSSVGEEYLREEKRVYVKVYDGGQQCHALKPFQAGFWKLSSNVIPIEKKKAECIQQGISSRLSDTFHAAMEEMKRDGFAQDFAFQFEGTLEVGAEKARLAKIKRREAQEKLLLKEEEKMRRRQAMFTADPMLLPHIAQHQVHTQEIRISSLYNYKYIPATMKTTTQ